MGVKRPAVVAITRLLPGRPAELDVQLDQAEQLGLAELLGRPAGFLPRKRLQTAKCVR